MANDSENKYKRFQMELFEYLRVCGNNTSDPPTTPGGMMVRPVTTGMTLNIFDAPSKLRAAIFHSSSPQLMGTRLCTPCVGAIRLRNTLMHYALEVLLTSKELKRKGGMLCPERHRLFGKDPVVQTLGIQ